MVDVNPEIDPAELKALSSNGEVYSLTGKSTYPQYMDVYADMRKEIEKCRQISEIL